MQWLRLYHDLTTDPKWRLVAVESGQPVGNIIAVYVEMLICASKSADRGTLTDWQDRVVAANLGYKPQIVTDIREAMQGVVLDGDKLTGWEKRQRASDNAAERQRKTRSGKQSTATKSDENGGHGGNGVDPDGHETVTRQKANVTRQNESVTRQTPSVAGLPLRAQTPDTEDSVASATGPQTDPERPLKSMLFGECLKWFMRADNRDDERKARKLIGRWIADYSEEAVLGAFIAAQREQAMAPVSYITKTLQAGARRNGRKADGSKHDDLANGLAGAFIDQLDPGSEAFSGDGGAVARRYH